MMVAVHESMSKPGLGSRFSVSLNVDMMLSADIGVGEESPDR